MPDFDVFSLLECRKHKTRSHGIRKNGNYKIINAKTALTNGLILRLSVYLKF